jgi:hypothetical protein
MVVGVRHDHEDVEAKYDEVRKPRRLTEAWVRSVATFGNGDYLSSWNAQAICSLKDNFCKRTGRKLAASKLLKKIGFSMSKEDRRKVFFAVCPEYDKNTKEATSTT